jgi:hypothetical protein
MKRNKHQIFEKWNQECYKTILFYKSLLKFEDEQEWYIYLRENRKYKKANYLNQQNMRNHIIENIIILLKHVLNRRKNIIIKSINAIIYIHKEM